MGFIDDPELYEFARSGSGRAGKPILAKVLRFLVDAILPPSCPSCRVQLQEAPALCPSCWSKLTVIERPFCDKTATPFTIDPGPGVYAANAYQFPPHWDRARASVLYEDTARTLVHSFKYSDRHEVLPILARAMARAGADILSECDLIIPIPLHARRLWQRRFNQAALLSQRIAQTCHKPWRNDVLIRRRATPPQVGLSREARARNMAGAFGVRQDYRPFLAGKRVVLVDDVMTTGATLNASSRVLKAAGASQVDVLVFARVGEAIALA